MTKLWIALGVELVTSISGYLFFFKAYGKAKNNGPLHGLNVAIILHILATITMTDILQHCFNYPLISIVAGFYIPCTIISVAIFSFIFWDERNIVWE